MTKPGKTREIVFRMLAGIVSALAAVALGRSLLGGPSQLGSTLAVVGEIGIFVAFASYAALGQRAAYKVLEAFGVTGPSEIQGANESAPTNLPDGSDQSRPAEHEKPGS